MSNIPVPFIQGATDAERVTEIASYLKSLSSAVERELMSIDSSNLNEDLRTRIDSSLTEHQDLSGFASKNYLKNHFYEKEHVENLLKLRVTLSELESILSGYVSTSGLTSALGNYYTKTQIENDLIGDTGNINWGTGRRRTVVEYVQYELDKIK